jgi:hypothetical protein
MGLPLGMPSYENLYFFTVFRIYGASENKRKSLGHECSFNFFITSHHYHFGDVRNKKFPKFPLFWALGYLICQQLAVALWSFQQLKFRYHIPLLSSFS